MNACIWKLSFGLGVRALSVTFFKIGWAGGLAFTIFFSVTLLETAECAGGHSGEGASTSSSKPEWGSALALPDEQLAPECLRSHIKEELMRLFNIGRKTALSEKMFQNFIEPLALDKAKVGFARALLSRIDALQIFHFRKSYIYLFNSEQEGRNKDSPLLTRKKEKIKRLGSTNEGLDMLKRRDSNLVIDLSKSILKIEEIGLRRSFLVRVFLSL